MKQIALFALGLTPALVLGVVAEARAEDSQDPMSKGISPHGNNRVSLEVGLTSGKRPGAPDPTGAVVASPDQLKEDYKRTNAWLTYEYAWFWDKTRFNTLVGAEILFGLGYFTAEKASPERAPEPSSAWSSFHGKFEGAFDYAPFHWQGSFAGRFVFGAGAGGEFGSYWHTEDGRLYPLVLTRLQLFPGSTGFDVGYRFIPTTTGDNAVREHRFSGTLALDTYQFGVAATLLKVHLPDQRWLNSTVLNATVGLVF